MDFVFVSTLGISPSRSFSCPVLPTRLFSSATEITLRLKVLLVYTSGRFFFCSRPTLVLSEFGKIVLRSFCRYENYFSLLKPWFLPTFTPETDDKHSR